MGAREGVVEHLVEVGRAERMLLGGDDDHRVAADHRGRHLTGAGGRVTFEQRPCGVARGRRGGPRSEAPLVADQRDEAEERVLLRARDGDDADGLVDL